MYGFSAQTDEELELRIGEEIVLEHSAAGEGAHAAFLFHLGVWVSSDFVNRLVVWQGRVSRWLVPVQLCRNH
jgi:hypothetical protein